MKRYIIILIIILTSVALYFYYDRSYGVIEIDLPQEQKAADFVETDSTDEVDVVEEIDGQDDSLVEVGEIHSEMPVEEVEVESEIIVDDSINLALPFISQAPTANWEQPFQDACEEASVLMVDYYYNDKKFPEPNYVESLLVDMVTWQEENWGGHNNLPIAKLATFVETIFGYQTEMIEDLNIEKIKYELNQGRPVIVPADGHSLDNPFFSGDGPDYHMLVIKGYKDNYFITNDPGTKRGENFVYTMDSLMDSIADWDTKKAQAVGPKVGLVLYSD